MAMTRRTLLKGAAAVATGIGVITSKEAMAQASQEFYDAIVIGTGFGGTIATLALNAYNKTVLVIERGTFFVTPETLGSPPAPAVRPDGSQVPPLKQWAKDNNMRVQYWPRPDHAYGLADVLQSKLLTRSNPYGLYNYQRFKQAHILTASGVGGGSLIYSGVNLRPNGAVLEKLGKSGLRDIDYGRAELFMEKYRGKISTIVTKIPLPPGLTLEQLGTKGPKDYLLLDRSRALRDAATHVAANLGIAMSWSPLKLSVTEYVHGAPIDADAQHTFCERQGRCILGCLPQARHTLNKTLYNFILSKDTRVTLRPESEVRTIKRIGDIYEVTYLDRRGPRGQAQPVTVSARAPRVFLAAGVLGTTEILLRSQRDHLLQLSDKLGHGFSTNGDFGAFGVGTRNRDPKTGTLSKMPVYPTRGPINTSGIHFERGGRHYTVEDAGIPSMFAQIVRMVLDDRGVLSLLEKPDFNRIRDLLTRRPNPPEPTKSLQATEAEAIDDVFFFNAMGEDNASGIFTMVKDTLDLSWKDENIGNHPAFATIEDILRRLSDDMNATYTPLPTWRGSVPGVGPKTLIVTHPLGGCRIGLTMNEGVVNEFGQVYDGGKRTNPTAVHPGLYIVDGSVIPGALAVNPTLTISAQALKAVEKAVGPLPGLPAPGKE